MSDPMPTVSVFVLCYQHRPFIEAALESVLAQEGPDLEIVVADDGSTDGTYEAVERLQSSDPLRRIRLLPRRENGGLLRISENATRGLLACRGQYIAFLDGDDLFLPGKLAAQVAWFERDDRRVLCGHDVEVFDSSTQATMRLGSDVNPLSSGIGAAPLVRNGVPFVTASIMVRRAALPGGYEPRLRMLLDWLLWIEILERGGRFGWVDGIWARYRRHSGNLTASQPLISAEDQLVTLSLVEARYPHLVGAARVGRRRVRYALGIAAAQRGDLTAARRYWRAAIGWGWSMKASARLFASYLNWLPRGPELPAQPGQGS